MANTQITTRLADIVRTDLYDENEVEKIVNAQNARPSQSIPTITFKNASGKTIYIYAYMTSNATGKDGLKTAIEGIDGVDAASVLDQAMFHDSHPIYNKQNPKIGPNRFHGHKPKIRGSIKLTFEKKKS